MDNLHLFVNSFQSSLLCIYVWFFKFSFEPELNKIVDKYSIYICMSHNLIFIKTFPSNRHFHLILVYLLN